MFVTLLYMHGVKDAGYQSIVNLLYQCDAASAGYCELAVPVCDGSAGGTRSGPGGEGLRRLLHGGCCQPAGGCPQAPPAPSSAGIFLFSLDCILLFLLFLSCVLLLLFLRLQLLSRQSRSHRSTTMSQDLPSRCCCCQMTVSCQADHCEKAEHAIAGIFLSRVPVCQGWGSPNSPIRLWN